MKGNRVQHTLGLKSWSYFCQLYVFMACLRKDMMPDISLVAKKAGNRLT